MRIQGFEKGFIIVIKRYTLLVVLMPTKRLTERLKIFLKLQRETRVQVKTN